MIQQFHLQTESYRLTYVAFRQNIKTYVLFLPSHDCSFQHIIKTRRGKNMAPPVSSQDQVFHHFTVSQHVFVHTIHTNQREDLVACIRTKVVTQMQRLDEVHLSAPPVRTTPSTSSFVLSVKSYKENGTALLCSSWRMNISGNTMRHNSPCGVLNSQLRFVLGTFVYGQTLFHLLEVGFDIFLYFRERMTSSEGANDLLPKENRNTVFSGLKA